MKKNIFIVLLVALLISCVDETKSIPATVLQPNKMVKVMTDIHLIEGELTLRRLTKDSSALLYLLYKKELFRKYAIDDSVYTRSFNYYNTHPELIDKIYGRIIDSLSLIEEREKL